MGYTITSSGEYVGGRVDALSGALWGPGYQFLLLATWNGSNTVLRTFDLASEPAFHEEQPLDPTLVGNDLAVTTAKTDRSLLAFKKIPGGKTSYLTWKSGFTTVDDSKETAYQDHNLELTAFREPGHPLFQGGMLPESKVASVKSGSPPLPHPPGGTSPHPVGGEIQVAGGFGASISMKALYAAAASITSANKMRLAIWRFDGGGEIKALLGSSPEDVTEPATKVAIVTTAEYLIDGLFKVGDLLTAVRHNSQLKLIRWRFDRRENPATLTRLSEVVLPEGVADCALTTIRTIEGVAAVTTLQLSGGLLKVIAWKLPADGSLLRWSEATAEKVSGVSCAHVHNSDFTTVVRLPTGQMRIILWRLPFNGSPTGPVSRLKSHDVDVVEWVKCVHQAGESDEHPGNTITMSRMPDNSLRLRRWTLLNN